MKRLLQELHQGKNLDKNLKEYKELALETYEAYSVLELTFSAYGLVEEISEDKTGTFETFGSGSGLCKTGSGNGRTQKPDYREDESVYCLYRPAYCV